MPPIDHLNPPPHPFWGFVADMQDHPLFAAYAPQDRPHQPRSAENQAPAGTADATNNQPQATAEDPPEIDPATLRQEGEKTQDRSGMPFRGRRRCGSDSGEEREHEREWNGRRHCGRGGRRGFGGPYGQPGFPFGPFGPFGPRGAHSPPGFGPGFGPGPHGRGGHRGGPSHDHPHGPPHDHHGPHHGPHRGGPHGPHHGPHHRHGHGHGPGRRGPSPPPPPGPPGGFDIGQFLNDLGSRIGVDLSGAAEGLGLDRFMPANANQEVDFEPKFDIFERQQDYIVHVSLPGAKKSDIGVDWDGEQSVLRVAGVVHRPNVDEQMLEQLIVDGRKRETGVFEKTIRLGTRRDPAVINVAGIAAKMTDGVLIITVPKSEKPHEKRDIPIAKSATPSPARNEKHVVFDADHEMGEAEPDTEIQLIDQTEFEKSEKSKGKHAEYDVERQSRESTGTVQGETEPEQLPAYKHTEHHDTSDWENFDDDDEEGEFIKINVD